MLHRLDARDHVTQGIKQPNSFLQIAESATTANFPQKTPIFELQSTCTVDEALKQLSAHNVLSAPVWDDKTKTYLGFADVADLMALTVGLDFLVQILPQGVLVKKAKQDVDVSPKLSEMYAEGASATSPWCPVEEGVPFRVVLKLLATKARRVPVLSKTTGRVIQIISQSAVTALLYERLKNDVLPDTPLNSGVGLKQVFGVSENDKARDAFQMMIEKNISAVAVFDTDGALLSCISTKDIRVLPRIEAAGLDEGTNPFDLTAREFVALVRKITERDGKTHAACVTVPVNASLSLVLSKMAATHVHRVFIVDDEHKAVGVISASDVLFILENAQHPVA